MPNFLVLLRLIADLNLFGKSGISSISVACPPPVPLTGLDALLEYLASSSPPLLMSTGSTVATVGVTVGVLSEVVVLTVGVVVSIDFVLL